MADWNPWHGCQKISAGCENCYVYRMDEKYGNNSRIVKKTGNFYAPVRRDRQRQYKIPAGETVWLCFTSDFLIDEADEWRAEAWAMIRERRDLEFFFITKRIDRLERVLPSNWGVGYENVGIGCTCENQDRADYRLPIFLSLPIKKRVIICEPVLGPINLSKHLDSRIDSVVVGGESGENARVCDYNWILDIREQCINARVNFAFRQTGARFLKGGRLYRVKRRFQHSQAKKAGIDVVFD